MQHCRSFQGCVARGARRVLQQVLETREMAHGGRIVSRRSAVPRDSVGRDPTTRDQPLEAFQVAVARGEVDGRGPEIVSLVEHTQVSVGSCEAVGVAEARGGDSRPVRALAVSTNVESLPLPYGHDLQGVR